MVVTSGDSKLFCTFEYPYVIVMAVIETGRPALTDEKFEISDLIDFID